MPVLNTADKIMLGATQADRVYLGTELVWEPAPVGPIPVKTITFDGESVGSAVAVAGDITAVVGTPTYEAGIHGVGINYTDQEKVDFQGLLAANYSGSLYFQIDSVITTGGSRAHILKAGDFTWRSGFKMINDGDVDPTIGGTNEPALCTWAAGDRFRVDWQANFDTSQITWRVFKGANIEGTVHDYERTLDLSGNTSLIDTVTFGDSNSPTGTDITFDTIRVYDSLVWAGPYA